MNHWLFITAAYALTLTAILIAVATSWFEMRRAEGRASAVLGVR